MTHVRTPRTFADAATRIAAQLGWAEAAKLVGRKERTFRDWSDPSTETGPTLAQALLLDTAYRATGPVDSPFRDAFDFQLTIAVEVQSTCQRELAGELIEAARESGEAIGAAIALTQAGASPAVAFRAFTEVGQAHAAFDRIERRIAGFLPTGTSPTAGNVGGTQA